MNHPVIKPLVNDPNLNLVFKTYTVSFDIIGNTYDFKIQVCLGLTKEKTPYVDILDILNVYLNGEEKDRNETALIVSNITTMFGQEWYENAVKEEALKDWEHYFESPKDKEPIDWSEKAADLLSQIEDDIDGFDYNQHVELTTEEDGNEIIIKKDIDSDYITRDLIGDIKHTVNQFFENIK